MSEQTEYERGFTDGVANAWAEMENQQSAGRPAGRAGDGSEPFTPENRQRLLTWLDGWLYRVEARPVIMGLLHAHDTEQMMHAAWRKRAEEAEASAGGSDPTEPVGTFECPVCGLGTPHLHDIDAVNDARWSHWDFERAYQRLAREHPCLRVPKNWAAFSAIRRLGDGRGAYAEPLVDALWSVWSCAWYTKGKARRRRSGLDSGQKHPNPATEIHVDVEAIVREQRGDSGARAEAAGTRAQGLEEARDIAHDLATWYGIGAGQSTVSASTRAYVARQIADKINDRLLAALRSSAPAAPEGAP